MKEGFLVFLLFIGVSFSETTVSIGVGDLPIEGCEHFNEPEWSTKQEDQYIVAYKECGGSMVSPWHCNYKTKGLPTLECAIKWMNKRFRHTPDQFTSLWRATRIESPKAETKEHVYQEERRYRTTQWNVAATEL